ncbi:MAG: hypothetical protein GY839_11890 [candidate division Zixibacteria bacterium]|nr:hypothetical protein [candidate division Zixibacteria bacterium]
MIAPKATLNLMLLIVIVCCSIAACDSSNLEKRTTLYPNGQLKEEWTVILDADSNYISQGLYVAWHENGQKQQEEYWDSGKLNGRFITWYDNGIKRQTGAYKDGKMNCIYMEWSPDGKKVVEGEMVAGLNQGKWTFWDENGNIYKQDDFKDGELIE